MKPYPFNAARYQDEDFATYQLRRWNENKYFKQMQKPKLFWNSFLEGRYVKGAEEDKFELQFIQ